ncbi:MAG TPA: polyprenol phosphomannose-dependent alpha 1,6 mannosyltransferase MptB [Nocardioides sp.]|jgi:alpha-1,6-mannosyltransferase|uniref:polyprenol phosphomannose-dependent alpha 1,6 mannosyltransferase MptB n=1 Tax=Nocardioides sp. TaxID=35761 RepID=UPI002E343CEB|nr:polyprenol phosphomannose-dependent alpha 1,6 mannosyltransferase MptB [Nocardioides sp.]HEX3931828.1 polyprenol phosphomannose-dependent alpha 1,6 mannosyltransferase MptB [Nocardioides sp.]
MPSPPVRRHVASTVAVCAVGVAGSALVARASYVVGALPRHHLDRTVATGPYRWVYLLGVALMVLSWLALGRLVLDPSGEGGTRRLCWVSAATGLPLLVAAPVTSQDVWTYLGQANVAAHGLDPYTQGPAAVPGPYPHAVAHEWLATGSPYGPLWLWLCRVVVRATAPHPWAGMFVLRGITVVGMVALGLALVRLARRTGARPEPALWLAVAGPFPMIMLLGGLHNDAVMLALLVGGVAVTAGTDDLRRALLIGATLVAAAAAIKVIALVALPFLPLVWWRYAGPRRPAYPPLRRLVGVGVATCVGGVAVLAAVGLVTGFGFGWASHVGDGTIGVRWLSVSQQIGNVAHLVAPGRVADLPKDRYPLVHPVGLVFLALALVALTLTARRRPPVRTLALAMLVIVLSSPAPRLWYLLWPLTFLVVDALTPLVVVVTAAASATLVLWFPASVRPQPPEWLLLVLVVALAGLVAAISRPGPSGDRLRRLPRRPGRTAVPPR